MTLYYTAKELEMIRNKETRLQRVIAMIDNQEDKLRLDSLSPESRSIIKASLEALYTECEALGGHCR